MEEGGGGALNENGAIGAFLAQLILNMMMVYVTLNGPNIISSLSLFNGPQGTPRNPSLDLIPAEVGARVRHRQRHLRAETKAA